MPLPILIDTDMGVDDAIAVTLALLCETLSVEAIVSVGGNVPLLQATRNIGRLLRAVSPDRHPLVGMGLDQHAEGLTDARHVFGQDGLGETDWPAMDPFEVAAFTKTYRQAIERYPDELTIICLGPLTNLAELWRSNQGLLKQVRRIIIMGGAIWCKGNTHGVAEFNFYRDPGAADLILGAGLPVTLVPLDLTSFLQLDESHVARLAGSDHPPGKFLASVLDWPLHNGAGDSLSGRFTVHDAGAVGCLIWPELFLSARMAVRVCADGVSGGKCLPVPHRDTSRRPITVLTSVQAADFLEDMLEVLCSQRFVV
jgi:inosine-uridine nucleoside N-ribohydrolase